jgi:hypothetical protein
LGHCDLRELASVSADYCLSPEILRVEGLARRASISGAPPQLALRKAKAKMAIHKRILEWQAANPTMTWIFWAIIWAIVFYLLFRPSPAGGA